MAIECVCLFVIDRWIPNEQRKELRCGTVCTVCTDRTVCTVCTVCIVQYVQILQYVQHAQYVQIVRHVQYIHHIHYVEYVQYVQYVRTYVHRYVGTQALSNQYLVPGTWYLVLGMHPYASVCIRGHSYATVTHPYTPTSSVRLIYASERKYSTHISVQMSKSQKDLKMQSCNCDR